MTQIVESPRRGRPVVATSARQAKLNKWNEMRAAGVPVRRGRPAVKGIAVPQDVVLEVVAPSFPSSSSPKSNKKQVSDVMVDKIAVAMEKSNRKKSK